MFNTAARQIIKTMRMSIPYIHGSNLFQTTDETDVDIVSDYEAPASTPSLAKFRRGIPTPQTT